MRTRCAAELLKNPWSFISSLPRMIIYGGPPGVEFLSVKPTFPQMNSGTAETIAGGGVPRKPEAGCAVFPMRPHGRKERGFAHLMLGNYETAAAHFRERVRLSPQTDLSRALLASALGHLGRVEEARQIWRELMNINPAYSFTAHMNRQPFVKADSQQSPATMKDAIIANADRVVEIVCAATISLLAGYAKDGPQFLSIAIGVLGRRLPRAPGFLPCLSSRSGGSSIGQPLRL